MLQKDIHSEKFKSMATDWTDIISNQIPNCRTEQDLEIKFVTPLVENLGFSISKNCHCNYFCNGVRPDYTCWATEDTSTAPLLVVEDKKTAPQGFMDDAIEQVQDQMLKTSAQFGLATNGLEIQMFQRHGRICVPRTKRKSVTPKTIQKILRETKVHLDTPRKALTVMLWNHKGGVGKTTMTANIAASLAQNDKKVLVVNFDLQGDINRFFGLESILDYRPAIKIYEALKDTDAGTKQLNPQHLVRTRTFEVRSGLFSSVNQYGIDIIPGDDSIQRIEAGELSLNALMLLLKRGFYEKYDYIFIDASPSWQLIGQSTAIAADVLIPVVDSSGFAVDAISKIKFYISEAMEDGFKFSTPPKITDYIVNCRFQDKTSVDSTIKRISETLQNKGFSPSPWNIPNYVVVQRSMEKGMPVVFSAPNNKASKEFNKIATGIFLTSN